MIGIIKKIFGKEVVKDPAITQLSEFLFVGGIASTEGVLQQDGYKDLNRLRMMATLCSGLINLTDRMLYESHQNKRNELIDQLAEELSAQIVSMFIEGQVKMKDPLSAMIKILNQGHLHMSKFDRQGSNDGSGDKDQFMWEFGILFAKDVGRDQDPETCILGANLLTNIISEVKIQDYINSIKS